MKRLNHIWNRTLTHKSEVSLIYLFQLFLGLLIGTVTYKALENSLGESEALNQLALGFDRTVIMDMLNNNSNMLGSVVMYLKVLVPIYLLSSIILQGGLLSNIKKGELGIAQQLKSGLQNFLPFVGIALISILIILLFALVFILPFSKLVGDPLITFSSEKPFVFWVIGLMILFSIWAVFTWSWSISARYAYIETKQFWSSIKSGFTFVKRNFLDLFAVGFLLLGLHLLLGLIYFLLMGDRGTPSWIIVAFGILMQQIFSYIRVFIRGSAYVAVEQLEDKMI